MIDISLNTIRVFGLLVLGISIVMNAFGCGETKSTTDSSVETGNPVNTFNTGGFAAVPTDTGSGGSGGVPVINDASGLMNIADSAVTPVGDGGVTNAVDSGSGVDGGVDSGIDINRNLFTEQHQLASEINPSAPGTVGIVTWSIDVAPITEAYIEFGLDTGYGMKAPVDLNERDYRTLLLGMKPERTYHFRIVARDAATTYTSNDTVIETGPQTNLIRLSNFNVLDETARERGFIVTSYWRGQGSTVSFIIDADGEIVWWYQSSVNGIARARISADGKNMWMIMADPARGGPLERVTMDTLDAQVYTGTVGSHDLTPVSGELMAYLDYSEFDCDSIFEINPSGNAVEVFESSDFVTARGCHGNALRYSQTENVYTFSDVSEDLLIVNRSGGVDWRLSERVMGGNSAWGGTQHGHHLLDNSIVVFANRGTSRNSSTAIEYTLDGREIMRYDGGHFSANLGDVQRLPGGNTLITYSNESIIHEIDAQRNLVLEINGGGSGFGYALWRETLYGPPSDILL